MRILTLPASFLLAFLLYLPFPSVVTLRGRALCALHARIVRLFTGKKGRARILSAGAFRLCRSDRRDPSAVRRCDLRARVFRAGLPFPERLRQAHA